MNRAFVRHSLALSVAAMGAVDLSSALLSRPPERLLALRHLVPTDVLDTSRTFTLLAGALLLLTANGMRRGKRRAFVTALFLCAVSVPVNLLKAFDFEEATVAAGLMFLMGLNGEAFAVKSRAVTMRGMVAPLVAGLAAVAAYSIAGCLWIERLYGPAGPSLARAAAEATYQMFGIGTPVLGVLRDHHVVRWFLHSISIVGLSWLVGAALVVLRPAGHARRHVTDRERVARLVREHGDSTVAAYALAPDTDWFFSGNGRAVIAYRFESDTLIAIGDPIGPPEEVPGLLRAFEHYCRDHDWQFAFYQARPERLHDYRERGWNAVHIGEDPVLRTDRFTLEGSAMGDVRRGVRKLERAGMVALHFVPGVNAFDPARDPDRLLEQMRAISAEWLRDKHAGEMGFCMGRFDIATLRESWLAAAWDPATRRVTGFVTWSPIWARRGWALDLMRRPHGAPAGVLEFLIAKSVEAARERGDQVLSLSLSALARVEGRTEDPERQVEESAARTFLLERLSRFYDFQGLFRWKKKFQPEFEDRYLVYPGALSLAQVALALVRAQNPAGLLAFLHRRPEAGPSNERAA